MDVRVIDGTELADWLRLFPSVETWLACQIGIPAHDIETAEQRWEELKRIGAPPPLIPELFLANRTEACNKLKDIVDGKSVWLKMDTHFPGQMADFVSAYIATLDDARRIETLGRCLIVRSEGAWNGLVTFRDRHMLIADFAVDDADTAGIRLLDRAKHGGHSVLFEGSPGGIPDLNRVLIPPPKRHEVEGALVKAGYGEERARTLALKSDGDLNALFRCFNNLSLTPEWAQGTDAAELAIANLLGGWTERSQADKAVAEKLSKKDYGEWNEKIRKIVHRPGTPLIQKDGVWKMVGRYEAWYGLGPKLFDEHLDRLRETAVSVLGEQDPQFELPSAERYAASIHGKVLRHSPYLRHGLAGSLALLGSHPKALTSCSFGKADTTAAFAVRALLSGADWLRWASLNDLLPLLAEAAPGEFLDAVDQGLSSEPCPFDSVFSQESSGIGGWNYISGLLWALETVAWDAEYLVRVVVILGELAVRDPGGNWGNRPSNSLLTILLPWLPQTIAPVAMRQTAVATLLNESPAVGWKLLLSLLPNTHQVSSGSHKPAWRKIIPDDWSRNVTNREYWEQVSIYVDLAMRAAKQDTSKLADLIELFPTLPSSGLDQLIAHLGSDTMISLPEPDRLHLWNKLVDLVSKHRKFADAKWAMNPNVVNELAAVAEKLAPVAPIFRYQRLFSERDFDLYEEKGNYQEQLRDLESRRQKAVAEILEYGSVEALVDFVKAVDSPWRVGFAVGVVARIDVDARFLPSLLESQTKYLAQFVGGFVWGRFRAQGWPWIEGIDLSKWSTSEKGQFLAYLPFTLDTWWRLPELLGPDESAYWSKANVNPYDADEGLEVAIDRLVQHGRPYAAIRCLKKICDDKKQFDTQQAIRVLKAIQNSSEERDVMNADAIVDIIQALQEEPSTNSNDLFQVEWHFLPLLNVHYGASPKVLEQRLANDPAFFCDVIRLVFRSEKEQASTTEASKEEKNIATNAYRLIHMWRTPPGRQLDSSFNGDALTAWLDKVKSACVASGHLKIALSTVGHVLAYAPADPDGLWLHRSVATALNAKDAHDMRKGFTAELFNIRGMYSWTGGKEERELAEKYRRQAEKVESAGYHRLANALRDLAASYKRDAEHEASNDPFDR